MAINTGIIEGTSIIEMVYGVHVSPEEIIFSIKECVKLCNKLQVFYILTDCLAMETGHTIFDIFGMLSMYDELGVKRIMREALLLPRDAKMSSNVTFYETACLNRGYNVRIFKSREEGIQWLLNGANFEK